MKRFLFLLMVIMSFTIQGWSQDTVIVGSGTTGNYTIPLYTFYKYSYSQQIYTADEITSGITSNSTNLTPTGVINAIAFQYISSPQTKENITILMGNISNSTASTWISPSSMQQVYSGSITFDTLSYNRWVNINLDSPFQWDGSSNIVVCVINNSGNSSGFTNTFYNHSTSVCKALTKGNNTDLYSSTQNPTNTPTTLLYRNNIRFAFGQAPTCPIPTQLSYSNISSNSANISWHENGTATQWIIEHRLSSDTSWNSAISQTVSDTTIQLSSLNSNTSYSIRVKSVCSSNDESNWKEGRFITACGNITNLPYSENFDSYGTSILFPTCWTRQSTYISSSSTYPYINTYNPSSSPGSLYFYCGSNNTYNLAVTSAFDTSIHINTLMASFKLKAAYLGSKMTIGVMSDHSDLTTFDSIASITPTTDWLNYDIDFSNYTGIGNYIAFKVASETFTTSIYLDDVNIYTIPTCRRPIDISATNITSTAADINFSTSTNANNIIAYYRIKNIADTNWLTTTISSSPASLINLVPNTIYEYYLVTECGDNDISTQTSIYTFRTACSYEAIPYLEAFTTNVLSSPCWSLAKGILSTNTVFTSITSSSWYYPTTTTPIADGEGGNIKINIYGSSFYEWVISPSIDLGQSENEAPSTTYQVECDLRLTKAYYPTVAPDPSTDDKFAIVISRDNGQTWSINNAYIWTNNSSSARDYGTFGLSPTHIVIPLTDSNSVAIDGTIKIGLYVESTASGEANNRELYIDNLAVNPAPACPTVYGVNLSLASTSSINVNFATNNIVAGESWNVAYGTAASLSTFNPDNASQINVISASDLPLSIANLTPGSTVYFAVQQTCLGAWSAIKSITLPLYSVSTPFTQTFDDSTNVNEWNFINAANNSSNWIIGNAFNYSLSQDSTIPGKSLYVSNDNGLTNNITLAGSNRTYATAWVQFGDSPEFKLSFDWKCIGGYYGYYAGYVMVVDPSEVLPTTNGTSYDYPASAIILYNKSSWTDTTITLDGSYANKLKKLVFCFNNYSSASGADSIGVGTIIDNLSIQHLSCGTPYNLAVDSVGSTGNDAFISWSSANNNASYLVEYKTLSSNTWSQVISNTNSYQLTGLYPSTKYNVRIKSICSATDSSNYTSTLTLQTACAAISIPTSVEGFESFPPSTCWTMGAGLLPTDTSSTVIIPNTYAWYSAIIEVSPGMGNSVYSYVYSYSPSNNWLITPTYDLGNGTIPATLEFDAVLKSSSGTTDLTGIDDRFAVVVSTDNGLTWKNENAYIWSNATGATKVLNNLYPAQHITIPLINSAGIPYSGDVKIGFYFESTISNASNNFYIDNLQINPLEICQKPTNINVDTIYSDNAYIS
ncbi:MAG: fibronectin type III domain-containing protein, partial [Bacteroidales bacterium]